MIRSISPRLVPDGIAAAASSRFFVPIIKLPAGMAVNDIPSVFVMVSCPLARSSVTVDIEIAMNSIVTRFVFMILA